MRERLTTDYPDPHADEPPEETSTRAEGRLAVASGLGSRDIETISAFVREMAVRSLIPMIEGKIRALNHQASPTLCRLMLALLYHSVILSTQGLAFDAPAALHRHAPFAGFDLAEGTEEPAEELSLAKDRLWARRFEWRPR